MTTAINLAQLPAPNVVEPQDYEVILAEMLADLRTRAPEYNALVESDPAYKVLEVAAYRELLIRQRVNDASRSVMVAYAKESDLDNLAALFDVKRQIVTPGDPDARPPIEDVMESDERLRQRVHLSLEGFSTAGPIGAYIYHALEASGEVKDVSVSSPSPGEVVVTVLSEDGNGTPSPDLQNAVLTRLNREDVRPLTDRVTVQAAQVTEYTVDARLTFYNGPDMGVVAEEARKNVADYVTNQHRLGYDIALSGLYAALHQPGVQNVQLNSPAADIIVTPAQAAYCAEINVVKGGLDE